MEKDRKYSFTINGLTETIGQVEILSARLADVEKQLDTLSNKRININVGSSGGGGGRATSSKDMTLEENKALEEQKQIRRQLTKEVQEMIAADRLQSNQYADTLNGMRQKLADLKRALGGVEVGSQKFDKLIAETDALNSKVKQLEQSYGVFQRSVGNYANSFREAMSPLQVTIQGIEYQFGSFREAMRALSMELATLKATGQGESERYAEIADKLEEMKKQYKEIDSTLKDMDASSQVMDDMLDTFQSFTALASVSKGLSAFFGFDDAKLEKSLQQLLGLQNVLQGIEAIRNQMITKEGLGKYLASANSAINKFSTSLLGTKTALNGVAAAETQATVASKALGVALKGIGIGLLIAAIPYLLDGISKVVDKFKEWLGISTNVVDENNKIAASIDRITYARQQLKKELDKQVGSGEITPEEARVRQLQKEKDVRQELAGQINEEIAKTKELTDVERERYEKNAAWSGTSAITEVLKANEKLYNSNQQRIETLKRLGESTTDLDNKQRGLAIGQVALWQRATETMSASDEELQKIAKSYNSVGDGLQRIINLSDGVASAISGINASLASTAPKTMTQFELDQAEIDAMANGYKKVQEQHKQNIKVINAQYAEGSEERRVLLAKENRRYLDELKRLGEEQKEQVKRQQQELYDVEVASMKEGLAKILMQLEHERQERLNKARQNIKDASLLRQAEDTINATYDKKETEAREKHQKEVEKQEREFAQRMAALDKETLETRLSAFETENERMLQTYLDRYRTKLLPQLQKQMDEESIYKLVGASDGEMIKASADMYNLLLKQNYDYLKEKKEQTRKAIIEERELQFKALRLEENSDADKRSDAMEAEVNALQDALIKEEITLEEYNKKKAEVETRYYNLSAAKAKEYSEKRTAILEAGNQKLIEADKDYYNWVYNARETAYARLNALSQKQPETNALGLPSLKKTKENFQQIEDAYRQMLKDIWEEQKYLTDQAKNGDIGFYEFQTLNDQLEGQKHEIIESLNDLKQRMSKTALEVIQQYVQVISQYSQMIGQTILSIMQSNNDLEDKIYQHRIDELNKFIDNYDEALQRQQEITDRHNDALKSADEELDTARGDRRDQLIDIINAEVEAQRASLAEEKRIEKEKERLQKQVEAEEKKQREREWQRSLTQAVINGSLAIINGFATAPFIPAGIAAGALATMLTGIQIANIRAQRQYLAEGGVIVGNAHSNGGVKVLGGQAEVEGGEYIVNKRTTSKNSDLLGYINSKKRRVTLSDMDAFFKGARNNFINHSTKFANGGQLPNIQRNVNDNLSASIRQLIDRPVVVSVEEIDSVRAGITRVRALAGAED